MKSDVKICRLFSGLFSLVFVFTSLCFSASAATTTITVTEIPVTSIDTVELKVGTSKSDAISSLPITLSGTVNIVTEGDSTTETEGTITGGSASSNTIENYLLQVTWDCLDYNAQEPGDYLFRAQLIDSSIICPEKMYPYATVRLLEIEEKKEEPLPEIDPDDESGKTEENPIEDNPEGGSSGDPSGTTPEQSSENTPAPSPSPNGNSSESSSNTPSNNSGGSSNKSSSSQSSSSPSSSQTQAVVTPPAAPVPTPAPQATATTPETKNNTAAKSNTTAKKESAKTAAETTQEKEDESPKEESEAVSSKNSDKAEEIPIAVTTKSETTTELSVGKGKAVINVQNEQDSQLSSIITDEVTLLESILTESQLKRVSEGATANLRIATEMIKESDISKEDSTIIKNDLEEYQKSMPGLKIAGYVDIGIYLQMDDEDWTYVSDTNKPVELVIKVPDAIKELSESYYILRLHDGKTDLFEDNDDDPDTITISSGKFSIYVVMYDSEAAAEIEKVENKEMSTLIFIVSALVLVLALQIIYIFFIRKKLQANRIKD